MSSPSTGRLTLGAWRKLSTRTLFFLKNQAFVGPQLHFPSLCLRRLCSFTGHPLWLSSCSLLFWIASADSHGIEVIMSTPTALPSGSWSRPLRLTQAALVLLTVFACGRSKSADPDSAPSAVSIKELAMPGYDRYEIELKSDDPTFIFPVKSFRRGAGEIEIEVPAGSYTIRLDYFLKDDLVFGAGLCPEGKKNNLQTFVPGPNEVAINVCARGGQTVSTEPRAAPVGETFSVKDGKLYDKSGKVFVMRGINMPHAYFYDQSLAALDQVKTFGFNSIRMVWCADTLMTQPDRCNEAHLRPASDLEKVFKRLRELKLVAVLNLQNATGSNSQADLQAMVDYLLKPEIKAILIKNKDILLINMANEWYGRWDKTRGYVDAYKAMIPQLRKAGLDHTLIIDARGYGQDFSSIPEHGTELLTLDKNIMFSAHMYDSFGTPEKVKDSFAIARKEKLPLIIGEFACSHGSRGTVACDTILSEAENPELKVGTLAWSYTGNSSDLSDLDLVERANWKVLTAFGKKIVESPFGSKATGKEACFFSAAPCP